MRMMPTHYASPAPARAKPHAAEVAHVSAPLKGLNLSSKLSVGDPLTAPILTNFVVEDDRIQCRSGTKVVASMSGTPPVERLIPWYGSTPRLLAAGGGKLFNAMVGTQLKTGFAGSDWSWTSFANLSQQKYTVMCNGKDGVWSWDGSLTVDTSAGPVAITNITKANPAVCTVAAADIGKFANGQTVLIAGVLQTGFTFLNGYWTIASVNSPANTFQLVSADTSTATAASGSGTADPIIGGIRKEVITAPPSETWINPDRMNICLVHMNRLWFADDSNLAIYYLPLQTKSGQLSVLPLNAIFRRGGSIAAMATWTLDGGTGVDDRLAIFTTGGEVAIYQGTNPDADWNMQDFQLVGVFRFDPPMSKHCVANFGGDLYVLISTGLVPMTTLLRAESEQLGQYDRAVTTEFLDLSTASQGRAGWETFTNPQTGRLICNIPEGAMNKYSQMVRAMTRSLWSKYEDIPSRCWAWVAPFIYFGDDSGRVWQMGRALPVSDDDGVSRKPIRCDVQMAWSLFKSVGIKQFKMLRVYTRTDSQIRPFMDIKVDYDLSPPEMQPDVSLGNPGSDWDTADWDTADWARGSIPITLWQGVGSIGRVGAPRVTALVRDCDFSITGFDVVYEGGAFAP